MYLRNTILLIFITIVGCNKTKHTYDKLNPKLQQYFYYQKGSYWVYQDSLTGAIDSFYSVSSLSVVNDPSGNLYDEMNVVLKRYDSVAKDTECIFMGFIKNTCSVFFLNNNDVTEQQISVVLFNYPYTLSSFDEIGQDHGSVTSISSNVVIDGVLFTDTTVVSTHSNYADRIPSVVYNDLFYINNSVGLTKIVFDHPQDSVKRVLQLKRYKIVK